jgi:hypothetical protein
MKRLITASVFLTSLSSFSGASNVVKIEVTTVNGSHDPSTLVLSLTQKGSQVRCATSSIPEHAIRVKGLNPFTSPMKNASPQRLKTCKRKINWNGTRFCSPSGKNPMIDDMIRWCLNI